MIDERLLAFLVLPGAFLLDALTADPRWFPHPVRGMGFLVTKGEVLLRRLLPKREYAAGTILVAALVSLSAFVPFAALWFAGRASVWAAFALALILADCCVAARGLAAEAMKVYRKTKAGDLAGARAAVSMIVGRDTERLFLAGVNKAAVETVAESLCDGVIAPLFYLAIGGVPLAFAFKAVSTMDSMIGYKNSCYIRFGRAAAKLDDALNFLPARVSGLLIIASSALLKLNAKNAWKVFARDRFNHASPNSGHPEAAAAGALGVALAGNAWYNGELEEKKVIGDDIRPIECEDIKRAIVLMYVSAALFLLPACALRLALCYALPGIFW